jgi:hypothetical protein
MLYSSVNQEGAMRLALALLGAAMFWPLLSGGAAAQNGLERFEREIKPRIELEQFTYGGAQSLGNTGFVLTEVVAVMPAHAATGDKASTLRIDKVTVEEIDFDRIAKENDDDMPRFAKLKFEGMTGDDELFSSLASYGVPKVPVDMALDYRLDGASKVFTLNKLEIRLRGQARLSLSLVIDGIEEKASKMDDARDDGRLRSAAVTFEDSGLMATLLPAVAKEQGTDAEAIVAIALLSIANFADGQGAETLRALDTLASFIGDWKRPKGPLALGLKPAKTAGLADLGKVLLPNGLIEVFGFSADYAGTRAGAATAMPNK